MKQKLMLMIVLFLLVLAPVSVAAQTPDATSQDRSALMQFLSKKWPNFFKMGQQPSLMPRPTGAVQGQPVDRATKIRDTVTTMLGSYEQRQSQYGDFLTKLKARRDKMQTEGTDVTHINTLITKAEETFSSVEQVLATQRGNLDTLDTSADTETVHKTIKTNLGQLLQTMNKEHTRMSDVVHEMQNKTGERLTPRPTRIQAPGQPIRINPSEEPETQN